MSLWPVVTKKAPCPICQAGDWCAVGERVVKCMRVPSARLSRDGGWYHPLVTDSSRLSRPLLQVKAEVKPLENADEICSNWYHSTKPFEFTDYANRLSVSIDSLHLIGASKAREYNAWAFPMSDGEGTICGVRLRNDMGDKWAIKGSKQGIFLPSMILPAPKFALICEGPTDTAAALTLGYFAIGRPSCNSGEEIVKSALDRLGIHRVVIVGDNDRKYRKDTGEEYSPGLDGLKKLASILKKSYCYFCPPAKDIREFVKLGGTKAMVDSVINSMIWKK